MRIACRAFQRTLPYLILSGALLLATGALAQSAPPAGGGSGRYQGGEHRGGGMGNMPRVQGEVTAVSGSSITVKSEEGAVATIATTDNTRLMHSQATPGAGTPGSGGEGGPMGSGPGMGRGMMGGMQPIKVADIHVGDGIMAMGQMDPSTKTLHAMFAVVTDASVVKALKANLGKTYISGKVTAVDLDNARMTLTRPDGVAQTIGFDETTSFHRGSGRRSSEATAAPGSESITLADIKAGDTVMGQGSVKNGTFVPKDLAVMGQHSPRPEGGAGAPATAPAAQP